VHVLERWSLPATGAGCGLKGSYVHVPATGEAGVHGQLQGKLWYLSPAAGGIHTVCMYFPMMDLQPDQPEGEVR